MEMQYKDELLQKILDYIKPEQEKGTFVSVYVERLDTGKTKTVFD